jgi:hypothetical protein
MKNSIENNKKANKKLEVSEKLRFVSRTQERKE